MPFVNGTHYRSAGQGYSAEKSKMSAMKSEGGDDRAHGAEDDGDKGSQTGSVVHVKHNGGGKMSVKHEDGSVTQHDGMEDLHQHMAEHFGLNDAGGGEDSDEDDSGYEGGDALKSILGNN